MTTATRFYVKLLEKVLNFRYLFVALAFAILASSLFLAATKMKTVLFPSEGIEAFFIRGNIANGTALEVTENKFSYLEPCYTKAYSRE